MKTGILYPYMSAKGIPTGDAKIWYSGFRGLHTSTVPKSGHVYNNLFEDEEHTLHDADFAPNWPLKSGVFAGLLLGNDSFVNNGFFKQGGGREEGSTDFYEGFPSVLQVMDAVDFDSWTIFLDIEIDKTGAGSVLGGQSILRDRQKVLVSSMYSPEFGMGGKTDPLSGFNISLNDKYTGGGCWFTKQEILVKPPTGYGIVHPGGISHRHGARSILTGERYQLVSFIKSRVFDHIVTKENGEQLFYQ